MKISSLIIAALVCVSASVFAVNTDIQFFRNLDMNTNTVKNVATPVNLLDGANKSYVDAALGTGGFLSNMFWVAMNGDDATANGSINRPFKTIQGAVNKVAANGDNTEANPYTIRVASGSYSETINLNSPGLKCLVIMGTPADLGADVIVSGIVSTNGNDSLTRLLVGGLALGSATFEGESEGSNLGGNDALFYNCSIGTVSMKNMNCAGFQDCKIGGDMLFENAMYPYINQGAGQTPSASLIFRYDGSKKKPAYAPDLSATIERTVTAAPQIERIGGTGSVTVRLRTAPRVGYSGSTLNVGVGTTLILQGAYVVGKINNLGTISNLGEFYDGTASGLAATNMQEAVDVLSAKINAGVTQADIDSATNGAVVTAAGDATAKANAAQAAAVGIAAGDATSKANMAEANAISAAAADASMKADAAEADAIAAAALDATAKAALKVSKAGDTMTGNLDMGGKDIQNVGLLSATEIKATTMSSVYQTNLSLVVTNLQLEGTINMNNNQINNLATPTLAADAATKAYVDSAAGTNYNRHFWVSTDTGNDANNGSFLHPFKTLQKAVDTAVSDADYVIHIMQTMTEGDVTIAKNKITIVGEGGYDCHPILLYSRLVISGAATTRVRMKDIHLRTFGLAGDGVPLTINGTAGRHKFDNVTLYPANGYNAFSISGSVPNNFWSEFIGCAIMGTNDLSGTLAGAATITYRQCSDEGMIIGVNSAYMVSLTDVQRMGKLIHNAGAVVMRNVHSIKAGAGGTCIDSTAPLAVGNGLFMSAVNFQQANLAYGLINKTGACPWAIDACNRDTASDVLTGSRINFTAFADDLSANRTAVNYTASDASVKSHLAGIDTALGTASGSFVLKSGDTMTGALTLPGAPTADDHAATKAYVDTAKGEAISTAAADATGKADAAQAAAVGIAAGDATTKADAAQAAAVATAAGDATTKANAALADAKTYTDNATNVVAGSMTLQKVYDNGSTIQKTAVGGSVTIKDTDGTTIAIF